MNIKYLLIPVLFVLMLGCSEDSTGPNNDVETAPEIQSVTAEKLQILYGGQDPAILTCNATGGNLKYVWEVDLGDIIPLNSSRSKVSFNGSACCVGEKTITCTVSNSLGSTSKSIVITILEKIEMPEIILMESDTYEISAAKGEKASLLCYAFGGGLSFTWSSDCGEIIVDETDSYKATLTATPDCVGTTAVTCVVKNEVGEVSQTTQIIVLN
jgi:hypothetical protein